MCLIKNSLLISFIFLSLSSIAEGLDTDRKQKVNIIADSGIYNYKTGINIYEGHVRIDQGTTHLTADRLITKNNAQHKIQEAIAYGLQTKAHYWTLPNLQEKEIHAWAKIIKFYPTESNATLEKEVFVKQGENSFQGELINYNSKEQTISVPAAQQGRAVLVYNPDK
ncbi:MAG: lipopolysaccharide transport periplasmic protein LptA [Gammaproteobacteria bacterium]|nr:lipopolysaccharide transport periplasmic protein LptA [Gammaproteobacteria bacterium]